MRSLNEWIHKLTGEDPPERCLFRVDAGNLRGLSFGHLARCLTLASALEKSFGTVSRFLMRDLPEGTAHAQRAGADLEILPLEADEGRRVLLCAEEFRADWFILDLPYEEMDTSFFPALKERGTKIIFIDDSRFVNPGAHMILNSSILAPERFESVNTQGCRMFLGPEYFIFDPSLLDAPMELGAGARNIVISFGGADPTGLTEKVVAALLKKQWHKTLFHIVLGPGYGDQGSMRNRIRAREGSFRIISAPENIIPCFAAADLVLCAGGRTMYELLHMDKSFIPMGSIEHETEAIEGFLAKGLIHRALPVWDINKFAGIIESLREVEAP